MSDYPVVPGAVNITYGSSGQIIYTDDAGATVVYSVGDIAWVMWSTALGAPRSIHALETHSLSTLSFQQYGS